MLVINIQDNMYINVRVYIFINIPLFLGRENDQWELEKRHLQEQHQLQKQNVREAFHMQRHQMQMRHQKVHIRVY